MSKSDKTPMDNNLFQQFKMFSEALPTANIILKYKDEVWSVLFFNEMLCEMLGCSRRECEAILKVNIWGFVDLIEFDELNELWNKLLQGDKRVDHKLIINGKNKQSYVNASTSILESNNDCVLVSCVLIDVTEDEKECHKLNQFNEDYKIIASLTEISNQYVFKYDFATDLYEPHNDFSKPLSEPTRELFSGWIFLNNEYFDNESQTIIKNFFSDLKAGVPSGNVVFKTIDEDKSICWYKGKYSTVFNDKMEAKYSIIYFKNITDIRNESIQAIRFQDLTKVGTNHTFLNIEYNITTDTLIYIEGYLASESSLSYDVSGQENIELISEGVHPEDKSKFKQILSFDRILSSFSKGINRGHLDFRYKLDNEYVWLGLSYHVLKDPYSSDIILWVQYKKIDDKKKSELRLANYAERDELTGLYIHSAFKEKTINLIDQSHEDLPSALVMIDIDNFARVNNEYGFTYGDTVLRDVARSMRLILGENDIIGRLTGTNFLIYTCNNPDGEILEKKLDLINMVVSRETKDDITLSISMGVAIYGGNAKDYKKLYEYAEIALSNAKVSPNNKCVFYKEGLVKQKPRKSSYNEKAKIDSDTDKKRIDIRTFGYFDLFIDNQAILIPHGKSKELLALLVHRKGGFVTPQEIISHLWEDEGANKVTLSRCRKVFMLLRDILKEYNVEDILESNQGSRRIIPEKINCDLYNYLSGDEKYANLYKGYYMLNYSWGEYEMAELDAQAKSYKDMAQ